MTLEAPSTGGDLLRWPATRIKAVILDLDGLMVDSEPIARRAWEQLLSEYGCVLDDDTYARMVGLRTGDSSQLVQQRFRLPLSPAALGREKARRMARLRAGGMPVMPGLGTLLDEIDRRRLPWGVATSSQRDYAEEVLSELDLLARCHALAAGNEAPRGKPAPDIYLLAASRLGVSPGACLALEDSVPGGRAALAAGMTLIGVPNGHFTAADFHFTPHVFASLAEVAGRLDTLLVSQSERPGSHSANVDL